MNDRVIRLIASSALCVSAIAMTPADAFAGAWTQPDGEYYAKIWGLGLVGSAGFDKEGETFDVDPYRNFSANYYVEYGLMDRWTILSHGRPVGYATYDGRSTPYVDDVNIGVRRGFVVGPLMLGIEGTTGFRGIADGRDLASDTSSFSYLPAVATSTAKLEGQAGIGFGNGWAALNAGWRGFGNPELSDLLVGLVQVGYTFKQKYTVDAHFPINLTLSDYPENNIAGSGNTDYVGLGFGFSWWMKPDVALHAGFDGVVFAKANSATPAVTVGVELR